MAKLHDTTAVLEDADFIANTGRGLTEAARRLGFTSPTALERWLLRLDRRDLVTWLKANDPIPLQSGPAKQWQGVA